MRTTHAFRTIAVLLALAALARADGALYRLPKDGTWASYQVEAFMLSSPMRLERAKGEIRMASVGQTTVDGQPCRWIEISMKIETTNDGSSPREEIERYKVLIPEKFLARGESPLAHAVRAWHRRGAGKATRMADAAAIDEGPLPILLSGPPKDLKSLPDAEVESKLGKRVCQRVAGRLELAAKNEAFKIAVENALHADAPFGLVASHWKLDVLGGVDKETVDWTMTLADYGEKATSEMPETK